jgi:predicted nucleic-acid-binding protein
MRLYKFRHADCAMSIRALLAADNVVTNRTAVEAGLALLDAGGDFADGVMAYEGCWLGGDTFVSFDTHAVTLLLQRGEAASLLQ